MHSKLNLSTELNMPEQFKIESGWIDDNGDVICESWSGTYKCVATADENAALSDTLRSRVIAIRQVLNGRTLSVKNWKGSF